MLLQWMILEPSGPFANLAAVRFSSPVRVRSLRIFPTGSRPFKRQEEIVATTEPSALYLDVYFNAHPLASDGKQKAKPSNALVPTSIAYQGGEVEFSIDMGFEFATRLMIIRGKFEKLSLAVYGDVVVESSSPISPYEPRPLPHVSRSLLPPTLDPANNVDPTELAQSLLTLIPDSPKLSLIIRLMFCLKPSNDDWDEPDFPHLYSNLEAISEELNLERAVEITSRPVSDSTDEAVLRHFAAVLGDSIDEYNDDQAYFLAKLLSQCASQHPLLSRYILENADVVQMFTATNLDRPTLLYLLDAAASLDVSRQLNNQHTLDAISFIRDNSAHDDGARRAASRLYDRIKGWEVLEDSLSNTQAPFGEAAMMVKDIAMDENSFGIWLENMVLNHDILDRLLEIPPTTHPLYHPPVMWRGTNLCSQDDFIAFLRACIGVSAVVAVYAWSDSVPVEQCRERTLAVLRLWQKVNGYKEIVNHLLLMRQMTYRLECMLPMEDDLPTQAGIDAEHILKSLSAEPMSMLRADFVKVMQNLQAPLNYMTDDEVSDLKRASGIAKDGLSGAIKLLTKDPNKIDVIERRLDLQVAVATVSDILRRESDGERVLLDAVWKEEYNGLSIYLINHLHRISSDLRTQFALPVPPQRPQIEITALFQTCHDFLSLLGGLLRLFPVTNRHLISLTRAIADIFVCTDSADMTYAQESAICGTAHVVRQSCIENVTSLATSLDPSETVQPSAVVVFKALLGYASTPGGHDAGHHMTQIFWLFDHALPFSNAEVWDQFPDDARQTWVRQVVPPILPEIKSFYQVLECDNRLHLIKRFMELDGGTVGVAEWLVLEEQNILTKSIALVKATPPGSLQQRIAHWRVSDSLRVLSCLVQNPSNSSSWAVNIILHDIANAKHLLSNLESILELDFSYEALDNLVELLAGSELRDTERRLQSAIVSALLRATRCDRFEAFIYVPQIFVETDEVLLDEVTSQELGDALSQIANGIRSGSLPSDLVDALFRVFEKITPLDNGRGVLVLRNLSENSLDEILRWLSHKLPVGQSTKLDAMKTRWTVAGLPRPPPTVIPSPFQLNFSLENWDDMLSPPVPMPSTPIRRSPAQSAEMLGLITVSPPNALLRSPEVKGLTKTYANNDFRQLRQLSSSRQNTSRLPSTHVDDFEQSSSSIVPLSLSTSPPPPLSFVAPQRPLPIDPTLPMNPTYYQQ